MHRESGHSLNIYLFLLGIETVISQQCCDDGKCAFLMHWDHTFVNVLLLGWSRI